MSKISLKKTEPAGDTPPRAILGRLASVDEALELVVNQGPIGRSEAIALDRAGGRVLASGVVATRCAPACNVSAMDGFAVCDADLAADWNGLKVIGESFAGHGYAGRLETGAAVRIFTGAPAPFGADRVVLQEDVRHAGDRVFVPKPLATKRHIRLAGSDFRVGDILVEAGARLTPARLVAVAAADIAEVAVLARPRVIVVATGDELHSPGQAHSGPGSVPESVSFGVAELARGYGADVVVRHRLADDPPRLRAAAAEMLDAADVIVMIGGASVGERDYSRAMFDASGLQLLFSKVAMRPGKPAWFGRAGAAHIVGLPGNPTAALVAARLFLAPLIAGLAGRGARSALNWRQRPLAEGLEASQQWECFIGARLDGERARPFANRDSSAQKALAATELLIRRRPGQPPAATGDVVETLDF
jgi:molybdopterin molybdotransferase